MPANTRVLIMAGGTGGHVFPALATAEIMRDRGIDIQWLGTSAGIEADLVPSANITLHTISVSGLRGKGRLSLLAAPLRLFRALWQALRVIQSVRPDCVLGMGGFASGPGGLAAWLLRVPVLIHEQNAIPGMTNKVLSKLATQVMEAFPGAFAGGANALCTGNPIRSNIVNVSVPAVRYSTRQGPLRLLVIGGSLGAKAINETLPRALARIAEDNRPDVWHQAGKRNFDSTAEDYNQFQVKGRVVAFIDDMNKAYEWADLVLCRAGALTVSELCAAGVASLLVPYPHAVDDHQTENARYLTTHKAGVLLPQSELTEERLIDLLTELNDRSRLLEMAEIARSLARIDSSQIVAEQCIKSISGVAREG
ncbi:undecaprenyldiphospho-muramoylpentapeptide beta-N-acetylglucosaminyltransferase [Motiliproteus sp. MSK22-1]|nr:undecaprenyldiphospho-muramoylpentapeptide beta-N-acetylglucosaminyltransferase [Motiliproteus sp. MSK22-1]OMH36582.1 undecaprenyldiphospho-muramoylpentapeptide beta-N-acetylglucosaminyltransferase [Motiliproteus sp. MSK22-1]